MFFAHKLPYMSKLDIGAILSYNNQQTDYEVSRKGVNTTTNQTMLQKHKTHLKTISERHGQKRPKNVVESKIHHLRFHNPSLELSRPFNGC